MDNAYPLIENESEDALTFARCTRCENEAMLGHDGKGYCGMHYAEAVGWLEQVEDKDALDNPVAA